MGARVGEAGEKSRPSSSEWAANYIITKKLEKSRYKNFFCISYQQAPQYPKQPMLTVFHDVGSQLWPGEIETPEKLHDYVALAAEKFGFSFHLMRMHGWSVFSENQSEIGLDILMGEMVRQNLKLSNDNVYLQERFLLIQQTINPTRAPVQTQK